MIVEAWLSIIACLVVLAMTVALVKRSPVTLALPLSYMINLLLLHVPGAYAFAVSGGKFAGMDNNASAILTGIMLTAVAAICFLIGCSFSIGNSRNTAYSNRWTDTAIDNKFTVFCLASGWVLAFGVGILRGIPTIGAAVYFGSAIWMLAAMTSLAMAIRTRDSLKFAIWAAVLFAYPLLILLLHGFLSYGATAVIIVGTLAVVQMRSVMRSMLMIVVAAYLGISVFVNYFEARTALRSTLWSTAGFEQRFDAVSEAFSSVKPFSSSNPSHLTALTMRLNQNEFVGVAADRLSNNQSDYLKGRSFYEALIAPIPRVLWKDKPIAGGSGTLVREMTGIRLSEDTSWGVGNVMEFYINFGMWSLIPGFLLLGWLIGWLDRRAAMALGAADPSRAMLYFLPGIALIQPNGSLVEVVGGAFAALLAAVGLRLAWLMLRPSLRSGSLHALPSGLSQDGDQGARRGRLATR